MSKHLGLGGIVHWQLQGDVKIQRSQRKQTYVVLEAPLFQDLNIIDQLIVTFIFQ